LSEWEKESAEEGRLSVGVRVPIELDGEIGVGLLGGTMGVLEDAGRLRGRGKVFLGAELVLSIKKV